MNLVSVIIPYYRKKQHIFKTLKSVINQSYKKLEIILIYDDNKKDELNFIRRLCLKDKRIKLIINKINIGAGESRNKGIKSARGDYIAFIDADDIWLKHKTKQQLNFMKKNKVNFTHTSYSLINTKNIVLSKRKAQNFFYLSDLIKSCDIGLSTVMIKKNILKLNKFPNLKTKEDFVLWLQLLSKNIKIYGINKNLVLWKKIDNSLSSSSIQKFIDGYRVYHNYMRFNFFKSLYYLLCLSLNYLKK